MCIPSEHNSLKCETCNVYRETCNVSSDKHVYAIWTFQIPEGLQRNLTAKQIESDLLMGKRCIWSYFNIYKYCLVMMVESWYLILKLMTHRGLWIHSCSMMDVLEKTHPWDYLCIRSTFLLNGCILTTQKPHASCDLAPSFLGMS